MMTCTVKSVVLLVSEIDLTNWYEAESLDILYLCIFEIFPRRLNIKSSRISGLPPALTSTLRQACFKIRQANISGVRGPPFVGQAIYDSISLQASPLQFINAIFALTVSRRRSSQPTYRNRCLEYATPQEMSYIVLILVSCAYNKLTAM